MPVAASERKRCDAIDDSAEDHLEFVHRVNIGHAQRRQHRQVHDPDPAAEIAAVDGNYYELEDEGARHSGTARVVRDSHRGVPNHMFAKRKQQSGSEQQPWQNLQKRLRRRLDQEKRPGESSDHARNHQRDHDASRKVQFLRVRSAACRRTHPQRQLVRGICRDRRHSCEQERGKGHETPPARDRIDRTPKSTGKEQEYGVVKA